MLNLLIRLDTINFNAAGHVIVEGNLTKNLDTFLLSSDEIKYAFIRKISKVSSPQKPNRIASIEKG